MKDLLLVSLISAILCFDGFENSGLITENSIGRIALCQDASSIEMNFRADTSFNSDGFHFIGNFYGNSTNTLLAELAEVNEEQLVSRISTTSPAYQTAEGIAVNSSLNELLKAIPGIKFTAVISEYEDLYFFQQFENSRVEFRVDRATEVKIYKLGVADDYYQIKDVKGMSELLSRLGSSALIREIRVVSTLSCKTE